MFDIIKQFFILGLMSFGGPAAHIGYFHRRFIIELGWLNEEEFGSIVAISHLLPGPGSSQVGFAIGYQRAGWLGGLSAFLSFTLPSFLIMIGFAYYGKSLSDNTWFSVFIQGLKLLAVVVVVDAIMTMFKSFCKDKLTQCLCIITAVIILLFQSISIQIMAIVVSGFIGYYLNVKNNKSAQEKSQFDNSYSEPKATTASLSINYPIALLFVILFSVSFLSIDVHLINTFLSYFQAGSLVFGGGHVVLPLLQNLTTNMITTDTFLTGYALAQGVPGPMFTLATYLGFYGETDTPFVGSLVATIAIFMPGFLLLTCFKNSWMNLSNNPTLKSITTTINASVVGLLIAALYQPIFTSAVIQASDFAIVIIGLLALKTFKLSILKLIGLIVSLTLMIGAIS